MVQEMKLFFCVVLLCASRAWCEMEADCQFTVGDKNIKYDLSALINRGNEPYQVMDTSDKKHQHTYYFNFCNNIAPPTTSCINTSGTLNSWGQKAPQNKCDPNVREGDASCQAPVFQVLGKDTCYRLGKKFTADQKPEASFLGHNPLHGFRPRCFFVLFDCLCQNCYSFTSVHTKYSFQQIPRTRLEASQLRTLAATNAGRKK